MAVAQARMTEEEFMRLPDDGRKWELVDGEAREVPAGHEHGVLVINIGALLKPFARGIGFVSGSQAGFRMTNGNVRAPDVSFTRKERLPGGRPAKGFEGVAPDLAIEIISPSEEAAEMARKVREYFAAGASQVWHLFPETEQVVIFTAPTQSRTYGGDNEVDAGGLLPGFSCRAADLFSLE